MQLNTLSGKLSPAPLVRCAPALPRRSTHASLCPPVCFQDKSREQTGAQQCDDRQKSQSSSANERHETRRVPPKYSPETPQAGLGLACVLEAVLPGHPGLLAQVSQLTGGLVEPATVYFLYLGIVAYNTERGSSLWGPTFEEANLKDVAKRPKGPPAAAIDPFNYPMQFLGISGWGFTKRNEIFHGRIAMLSYMVALVRGIRIGGLYGPGPVAQVAGLLHLPCDYGAGAMYVGAFAVFAVAIAALTGRAGGIQALSEEDVY
ncbi:hypothetical protein DUNSADRAFT_9186 [Dunaliella salina]|uniref:Chlorophyll a-b binding protein, chloroplastic n=1 Tax=Dunaliella salina TaxID=3046 RepID=A0ABQ7GI68_DUNSA|nr:hypothetical protein DUNSADRAFT_9186 [Dunaliella salina]|eukprot:KAF5834233.1 hypothetical protein DUNSADRAFT_9186 [Dunaliella salina]